jgi:pimeloyl-ACP methyl ester carboxylesterase
MTASPVNYVVLASAGSAGLPFAPLVDELDATLVQMPDSDDVRAMAHTIAAVPRPRVLVGASLGAMVALECARAGAADGLVLIAAGFGIAVADDVLAWVEAGPPDLLAKMARTGLADRDNEEQAAIRENDFASRGRPVLLRHLQALAAYQPEPLADPPPTLVIWGERDRGVPLADHVELAQRCRGLLAPITGAGHAPFLERPQETARWTRWLGQQLAAGFPEVVSVNAEASTSVLTNSASNPS